VSARLTLPRIGEHTVEVLEELGVTGAEISALLDAKVASQLELRQLTDDSRDGLPQHVTWRIRGAPESVPFRER
jgi:hypothetical protein